MALPYPGRVKIVWGDLSAPFDQATSPGGPEVLAAHTYRVPGTYSVVMTTYDGLGRLNSLNVRRLVTRNNQPPALLACTPSTGPAAGGTATAVVGAGMTGVGTVMFGGSPATGVQVNSDNVVNCTTPAGSGPVTVLASASGRGNGSLPNGFTYGGAEEDPEAAARR